MMFLTKLMLLTAAETDADLSTVLEETKAVAEEVQEDLQNLKPNVILETVKSWLPGLMSFAYRLVIAILILVIGNRIVHAVRKFLYKTFTRMNLDPSISRFLISVADACIYALAIFIAADKIGIPVGLHHRAFGFCRTGRWPFPAGQPGECGRRNPAAAAASVWRARLHCERRIRGNGTEYRPGLHHHHYGR